MLTLLLILFGLSVVFGQKAGGKWFLKQLKNTARNFWRNHRIRVWSFFLGAGIAGIALSPTGFWWTLAIMLIALGGLLAAMAFAAWRDALDDFLGWLREGVNWLWQHYATQIRWGVTGAIVTAILKLA